MTLITSQLRSWKLNNARVLVRIDGNVPVKNGTIFDDFRLQQVLPTIDYLIAQNALLVLVTHLGRPKYNDPSLSTAQLVPWFKKNGYTVTFARTISEAHSLQIAGCKEIILLENIRFYPGEKEGDTSLAQELALLGDYFVNDAFGTLHQFHASITTIAQYFSQDHKTYGFLVEKEIATLRKLFTKDPQKTVIVLGGAKITEKIASMQGLMDISKIFLLCPALVFTFLKALNKEVGISLIDKDAVQLCKDILAYAQNNNVQILFPIDYQIQIHNTIKKEKLIISRDILPKTSGISIGPSTINRWHPILNKAEIIIFNGVFGFEENQATLEGINDLLAIFANTKATTIVIGGDSVAYVRNHQFADKISLLSTGGSAALFFLSHRHLPGIDALKNRTKAQ